MVQKLNMHETLATLSSYAKSMAGALSNSPERLDRIMNLDPIEAFKDDLVSDLSSQD